MHALKGRKQSARHIINKMKALAEKRKRKPWKGGGRAANTAQVLWSKVDIRGPRECWPWKGFRNKSGYGRTWINDKGYYAHRVIYHLANPLQTSIAGPKQGAANDYVRHTCDNPPCCNPAHLVLGTHAENMRDMVLRGRSKWESSVDSPRAKLSAEDVLWIRIQKDCATKKALAMLYGVSEATISGVVYGRHYQDI